ncbi:hypothetical protein EMWEY_00058750, partial [Eimeria maxima]
MLGVVGFVTSERIIRGVRGQGALEVLSCFDAGDGIIRGVRGQGALEVLSCEGSWLAHLARRAKQSALRVLCDRMFSLEDSWVA